MIAYLKKNFYIIQLIIFKPNTFLETHEHISILTGLKLLIQLIPFIILIPVITISTLCGFFQLFGIGFDWFQMLKSLTLGITECVLIFVTLGIAVDLISRLVGCVKVTSLGALWGVMLSVGFLLQYLRLSSLLIYPISYLKFTKHPTWARFKKLPLIHDEVTQFSFPLLTWHRSLAAFVQADRIAGIRALDFIIQERPWLLSQALRVLFEVGINDLCSIKEFTQIANAPPPEVFGILQNLPEEMMPKNFKPGDILLRQITALVAQYNIFTTSYSSQRQLEVIAQKVREFQRTSAFLGDYVSTGFVKVAQALGNLVAAEEMALQRQITAEPIPNPFVVGNPLRHEDKEVFQGREDVARLLENEIMRDKSMSPLLLYGKRRIGKTSTLLNLRKLLGPKIIPVYLDGQDAALTQSDAGFLYKTFAKIQKEIPIVWTIIDSLILPDRQEFETRTFELSDRLLGQLHERLQIENARVLLCLDEYERLDRAYEQGRITDDLLNQLRHYLQHETRLAFFLPARTA